MRHLGKCLYYRPTNFLDHVDVNHIERFFNSSLNLRTNSSVNSVKLRFYFLSTANRCSSCAPQLKFLHQIRSSKQFLQSSLYSTTNDPVKDKVVESQTNEKTAVSTSVIENVKETSKTVFWCSIIFIGFSFAASVFYVIITELFSSNSALQVYSKAFKYVSNDERVLNVMGDQLKGFGEETRRGRRQHVGHVEYSKDGKNYLRMKFYIKGNRGNGSVHLEMVENEKGVYDYRYMFVVVESDPSLYKKTIILEDNRSKYDNVDKVESALQDTSNLEELDLSIR